MTGETVYKEGTACMCLQTEPSSRSSLVSLVLRRLTRQMAHVVIRLGFRFRREKTFHSPQIAWIWSLLAWAAYWPVTERWFMKARWSEPSQSYHDLLTFYSTRRGV
jgi:hypothetical protein